MFSKRLLITLLSAVIIVAGSLIAIRFAKGYRPTQQGILKGTGLLAANSFPNGAQVYLNGKLTTATDTTLNLDPGEYDIEIKKDGYTPWKKHLVIEKELVTQTNATLFPSAPSFTPLTFTGATHVTPSPDGQRILFSVSSATTPSKNGIYVLDLADNLLSLQKGARQIAKDAKGIDLSDATFLWSPDGSQILLAYDNKHVLLDPSKNNVLTELSDITYKLPRIFTEWEEELIKQNTTRLAKFPLEIQRIATESALTAYISPDDERILYTIKTPMTLPDTLIPPVQAANSQPQERTLQAFGVYVYDRKDDRNFRVGTEEPVPSPSPSPTPKTTKKTTKTIVVEAQATPSATLQGKTTTETLANFERHYSGALFGKLQWFPDSKHILGIKNNAIVIKEYDNSNETVLYAGPFSNAFTYPWPNGSKVIFQTNFGQTDKATVNMYALSVK